MSPLQFLAAVLVGFLALAGIVTFFGALMRQRDDDGPPDPPAGDMPHVPSGAVGPK